MAYCPSTLSLTMLELLVHLDPATIPDDLIAIEAEIPDTIPILRLFPAGLPGGWRKDAALSSLQAKGGDWIKGAASGVLMVPSVIVPSEMNILINPAHPEAGRVRVVARRPFSLDPMVF